MSLPETLIQARQQATQKAGRPISFLYLRDRMKPLLLERTPTDETLRKMHSVKECPKKPDALVVWALAQVYEIDLTELDPDAADAIDNVVAITEARRRHPQPGQRPARKNKTSDQRRRDFPGKYEPAAQAA